ncbi:MAG: hypothetical protein AVDCRST_MAG49-1214, partial [uncultured Thermomicrobiales bacterium]
APHPRQSGGDRHGVVRWAARRRGRRPAPPPLRSGIRLWRCDWLRTGPV